MSKFFTKSIEEITERLIDYRGKTPPKTDHGIKLITAKVVKGGIIQDGNHEYIAEEIYDKWMTRGIPKQWDVLITTEAPLGEVAQLKTPEKVALAQRIILLRGKSNIVDQRYYFYALQSPFVQAGLQARATGTTVLGIKQSELRKVEIPLYSLQTQRKISAVLSAYDDLIENNTRRIAILEEMTQALYREWFVRGQVPGTSEVPGTFDPRNGRLPEGWRIAKLGEIAKEVRRSVEPTEIDPKTPYLGLAHMPRQSIALSEWGTADEANSTKLIFKKGEILFGKIRPYFHKVGVAPIDGVCSTDAIVIIPKSPEWFSIVLGCVSSTDFVDHATQTSKGTKMPRADWNVLVKYQVTIPPEQLLLRFNAVIEPIVMQLHNLIFRNANLRQTRDLLLPRLISGELDVSSIQVQVPGTSEVPGTLEHTHES